ncbi:MAG: HAD-IB family phosphatase [Chloroflexi bacterium]|nr:HAD-IB family phosphatase [Chloroflexota bacterium]
MLVVACNFDNTIVVGDIGTALWENFGPQEVEPLGAEPSTDSASEERSIHRYAAIKGVTQADIEDLALGSVVIRYAFDEFLDYCHGEEIKLVIISDGLDIYIRPVIELVAFGEIEVYAGRAQVTPGGIQVERLDPSGQPIEAGFKESWVRHFKEQGHTVIYVGSELSDIGPAKEADYVAARDALADYFEQNGLPFYRFDTFGEVGKAVQEVRGKARPPS